MYNFEQSRIVLESIKLPSSVPPAVARDDNKTVVVRLDTDGHPQSAPKFVWANDDVANAKTADAANAILVISFFIGFINLGLNFIEANVGVSQKIN
jgi:hypothetical protein